MCKNPCEKKACRTFSVVTTLSQTQTLRNRSVCMKVGQQSNKGSKYNLEMKAAADNLKY